MQIFVRSVDRTFAVNVSQDASLSEVKAAIEDIEFIPAALQRIVKDGETLSFSDISGSIMENETVVLLLDLAGGMRAKWRKKRMRRLRRKRRKMRQRAR